MATVSWLDVPEEHDYPAAANYLSLVAAPDLVADLVRQLGAAPTVHYKAKDILRAARLSLLPPDNPHVANDLHKVAKGRALSPILLVRGDLRADVPTQVADGYHRVCASFHIDENTDIPCSIVDVQAPT
jgi:hypothetical protein